LEGQFTVLVGNAYHMKTVPGRKTDVKDAEWIADLLRHGLIQGSFIPTPAQRQLRDLTRYRTHLVEERARLTNRLQMVLEDANVKLAWSSPLIPVNSVRQQTRHFGELGQLRARAVARQGDQAGADGAVRESGVVQTH